MPRGKEDEHGRREIGVLRPRPKSDAIACTAPARPGTRAKALALPIGHKMAQRKLQRDVDLACVNVWEFVAVVGGTVEAGDSVLFLIEQARNPKVNCP